MNLKRHGMLEIHIAVLLFGLAGLFGKLLLLPPLVIVCGRTLFASITLGAILIALKTDIRTKSLQDLLVLVLLGAILAIHWITFFHSIQISTVAVGLLTFSTFPLFVTFMEPYFFREKLFFFDMLVAGAVLLGLILIVPSFDFYNRVTQGVFWGVMSGFTFAVLSILNRKYVSAYPSMVIAFYQNGVATILLIPFLLYKPLDLQTYDYVLLAILGVFCTALAHVLFIQSLVKIKAQLASVIASLEPVYGIIFAFFILGEVPALRTVMGGFIILGTIILATWKKTQQPVNVKSN
ncbi:MAG: EamA family transporter [Desulfobacterales bacterium]|nr:MAG: EamA family transporter [Desulfobacterales bacterium]